MSTVARELDIAVSRIARTPQLLVACDYDGTLAPIVEDPNDAAPLPEAIGALRSLASLPQTTVAVVSGRALRDLAALSRLPSEVHLVGSHGSEFDIGFVDALRPELKNLHAELVDAVEMITKDAPGIKVEIKPASIAVHTRGAEPEVAQSILESIRSGPATWTDIHVTTGKEVIELAVVATDKGNAVDALRMQLSASAVAFFGDDVTDEDAFDRLHGPDLGVKIGPGKTKAAYRVPDPAATVQVLALLLERRRRWLHGDRAIPIERHSLLSNRRAVALVTPEARISWLCHPKPDSSAVFADLLGGTNAGHFSISPVVAKTPLGQRYRPGTMTVETRWPGLTVADWFEDDRPDLSRADESTTLVRVIRGDVAVRVEFAPRPEFGQVPTGLELIGDGVRVAGATDPISLHAPGLAWEIVNDGSHDTAIAFADLAKVGGELVLQLRFGDPEPGYEPLQITQRQELAESRWSQWSESLRLPAIARDLVQRSALTLRGLWHEPTGAFLAAATTGLPEEFGGTRNWDHRYCWLRDAALSARALVDLGSTEEADALLTWVSTLVAGTSGHPERLHPLYTVGGDELATEAVIENLPGYAGSRPVRVGNSAKRQVELDVFGPVTELLAAVSTHRPLSTSDIELLEAMATAVQRRWHEPDHGLWEARLPPRHHIYSKVMCWQTLDRYLMLADQHGFTADRSRAELRDRIAANVLDLGWNEHAKAFTVAYHHDDIDASALWVGLSGLLPPTDPRFVSTVEAVERALRDGPTVYRYRGDDGMPGREGGLHLCTSWLIEAYLLINRPGDAEELFAQLISCAGPTGLLSALYDPINGRGLGNHPQAYSHLGLIRAALALDRA